MTIPSALTPRHTGGGLSRREMLATSGAGFGAVALAGLLGREATASVPGAAANR